MKHGILRVLIGLVAVVLLAPGARAFYPFGFFNDTTGGNLVFIKWPLSVLDANHDGDVSGDNEGVQLNFETGTDPVNQFTSDEVDQVFAGFEEWEHVSTAYMAFFRGPDIVDPVELTNDITQIDAFNVVVFQSTTDADLLGGALGVTLVTNSFEDTQITVNGVTFAVTGGQMLDVDTIIGQSARDLAATPLGPLMQGSATILGGLALGLDFSPLNNFDPDLSELEGTNIEDRVVAMRNFDGTLGIRGVTSSMYNDLMYYKEESSSLTDSHQDLAPDDISGVTFMYPRTDIDLFFNINQRARSQARQNFPSAPLAGAWIRAWCDADNNAGTARVPFVDTFTGLYENVINTDFRGHFQLKGLFQQLETNTEVTFNANYTITCSEFLPDVMGDDRGVYDSTHGGFNSGTGAGFGFDSLFPAEVFREGTNGNIIGLQNRGQGTPLYFDPLTRKVSSLTTGLVLDQILGGGRPMFGDINETCPLNVVVAGINAVEGPKLLRAVRDRLLLTSAVGISVADAYYRMAPSVAKFLVRHETLLGVVRWSFERLDWVIAHAEVLLAFVAALLAAVAGRRLRRRLAPALLLFALALALGAPAASAQLVPYKDMADFVAASTDVVQGTVESTDTYATDDGKQIYTDVLITVSDVAKGRQNKNSQVYLRLPTGRVGAIGRWSPQLPTFSQGEEVLLFLQSTKIGNVLTGLAAGKFKVGTDPKTGEKVVVPTTLPGRRCLAAEQKKMAAEKSGGTAPSIRADDSNASNGEATPPDPVKLDDFMTHLRNVDRDQKSQARQ